MSVSNITPNQKSILRSLIESGLSEQQTIYQFYMIRQNMYCFQPNQQLGIQKSSEFSPSDRQGPPNGHRVCQSLLGPLHMSYGSQGSQGSMFPSTPSAGCQGSSESPNVAQGSHIWSSPQAGSQAPLTGTPSTGYQGFHGGAPRFESFGSYLGPSGSQGLPGPSNGPTGSHGPSRTQQFYGVSFTQGSYPYMSYGVPTGHPGPQSTGFPPAGSSRFQESQNVSYGSQNISGPLPAGTHGSQCPPEEPQSSTEFPGPSGSSNGSQRYYMFPFFYASYPHMAYAPATSSGSQGYSVPQQGPSGAPGPQRTTRKAPKTTVAVYTRRLYDYRYDPRELAKLMDIPSPIRRQEIRTWTQERGVTQRKIAEDLGVSSTTISRYLGNKGYVSAQLEQAILVWFLQYRDAWNRVKHVKGEMLRIPYNRQTPLAICASEP